jgi:hypothetical protein
MRKVRKIKMENNKKIKKIQDRNERLNKKNGKKKIK